MRGATGVKRAHPFTIDVLVLLPDHLHCLWTLPQRRCELRIALKPGETEGKPAGQALDYTRPHLVTPQATGIGVMATPLLGTPDT
jgi:hypothetical protein